MQTRRAEGGPLYGRGHRVITTTADSDETSAGDASGPSSFRGSINNPRLILFPLTPYSTCMFVYGQAIMVDYDVWGYGNIDDPIRVNEVRPSDVSSFQRLKPMH